MEETLEAMLAAPPVPATHRLVYGDSPQQFVDLYLPEGPGPHPLLVAIHGGFWRALYDLGHLSHACAALASMGFAVASLEYRRCGQPGGGYPGTMDDVSAALALLATRTDLDLTRVALLGHSAGGQLALCAAKHGPPSMQIAGVIGLAPLSDLVHAFALDLGQGAIGSFCGGSPEEVPAAYAAASPAARLPLGVRQIVVQGELDDIVPLALAVPYCAQAKQAGDDVLLDVLPGADHFSVIHPRSKEFGRVAEHVRTLLT